MFAGISTRVIPDAVYDLAVKLYPQAGPDAIGLLADSLSDHDMRMLSVIALRDGPVAAEQFYRSRPRRLRVFNPRKARFRG